jgi:hypothetical protein
MSKPTEARRSATSWKAATAIAALASLAALPQSAIAGEGGTTHIIPGATATLADLPGTAPAWFAKPMLMKYHGKASARIPTAVGLTTNLDANATTFAVAVGRTFEQTVLEGAHYTAAVALPYTWLDISADVPLPGGGSAGQSNSVSGFGDMAIVPVMLAWKKDDWQIDAMLPIFAPTGNYQKGRLGNTGLNYWTFDPTVGGIYSNKKTGFNAMAHLGFAINTENSDTQYKSGSMLHLEAVVQQMMPMGKGILTFGAEGFWFEQVSGDSGAGATLGDFKGRTAGLGPLVGYILPMGKEQLVLELKWLAEIETKKRLEGNYVWLKAVYKF